MSDQARDRILAAVRARPPRSIVVVRTGRLGDVLMTTPALRLVKRRFPDAAITYVTTPRVREAIEGLDSIERVVAVEFKTWWRRLLRSPLLPPRIRRLEADLAISFSGRDDHLAVCRAAAPGREWTPALRAEPVQCEPVAERRLSREGRAVQWDLIPDIDPSQGDRTAIVAHNVGLVAPLLGEEWDGSIPGVEVQRGDADRDAVRARLAAAGVDPGRERLLAMHPGFHGTRRASSLESAGKRAWPVRNWLELGRLAARDGFRIVLTAGTKLEIRTGAEIAASIGPAAVVVAHLTVPQVAALYEMSAVFVGLDSGPMHVAAAVGTPLVAIFGPSSLDRTGPFTPNRERTRVLTLDLPCRPCRGREAICPLSQCLHLIEPQDVLDTVREVLAPARAAATR